MAPRRRPEALDGLVEAPGRDVNGILYLLVVGPEIDADVVEESMETPVEAPG